MHVQETLQEIDQLTEHCDGREKTLTRSLARGRALNVKDEFSEEAFELLSRAVKLSPKPSPGAWVELGHCYWKKGELESALNCFQSACNLDPKNRECLKSLSIVLRSLRCEEKERFDNLQRSLQLAKEAVEVDMTDGSCWTILGNAYLTMYCFSPTQDSSLLRQSKIAYTRAKRDEVEASQPDFMYNYANLLQLEEEYQEAIDLLRRASAIDPDWDEPKERLSSISGCLHEISHMVQKKSSLKAKRLEAFAQDLRKNSKLLGPYATDTTAAAPVSKKIQQLIEGLNVGTFVLVKVIGCVNKEKSVCIHVCVVDEECTCVAVTIYNLGKEPKIGDALLIPNPVFRTIRVVDGDSDIQYPSLRVENPLHLLLNGYSLTSAFLAKPRVDNAARP